MIGTVAELRQVQQRLLTATWTVAAIGALYEANVLAELREPHTVDEIAARCPAMTKARLARCLDVAGVAGVLACEDGRYRLPAELHAILHPTMLAALRGDVRSQLMQAVALLDSTADGASKSGWSFASPAMLVAQGDASGAFALGFKANMVGTLGDLASRLDGGDGRFLDVGAGVGGLTIAMCETFPRLHAVGLDAADEPLAIARERVTRASLSDRIELRRGTVETLHEESAYDLAWLPTVFIRDEHVPAALARIHTALRPGGWLLCPSMAGGADEAQRAVWALVNETWGGAYLTVEETEQFMKAAGFATTKIMPGPPWAPGMVVAQRAL